LGCGIPLAGNTYVGQCDVPASRTRAAFAITMVEAMSVIKRTGIGSSKALRAADLALPKGI
jgi:hypothetical protein